MRGTLGKKKYTQVVNASKLNSAKWLCIMQVLLDVEYYDGMIKQHDDSSL